MQVHTKKTLVDLTTQASILRNEIARFTVRLAQVDLAIGLLIEGRLYEEFCDSHQPVKVATKPEHGTKVARILNIVRSMCNSTSAGVAAKKDVCAAWANEHPEDHPTLVKNRAASLIHTLEQRGSIRTLRPGIIVLINHPAVNGTTKTLNNETPQNPLDGHRHADHVTRPAASGSVQPAVGQSSVGR